MRWPIRYQILLPSAAVMLLGLFGASLLNSYQAARFCERQVAAQLHRIAETLRTVAFPLTEPVLKQMRSLSGAEFVLTTPEGEPISASNSSLAGIQRSLPGEEADAIGLGNIITLGGTRYFHNSVVSDARGLRAEPAIVHILYPETVWREARWQAAWPPLAVGAAALFLTAILAFGVAGRLSRPILKLRTELGHLTNGDFKALPIPSRNDEIRDLILSVNSLADQLREMRQAIQRAERLTVMGQVSGGLIHHLRNDITGARIAVQLHQRHCHETDQESLAVALRQLSLTESHLQRFLATDAPKTVRRSDVDLRTTIHDLKSVLSPTCRHRKVELRVSTPDRPVLLRADAELLLQMLLNLTLNAIDAAGSGGWTKIELHAPINEPVVVRVLDSGPGPPNELASKLFEPLVTGKPEGIGLGLTVAQQVAEHHGGSIRFFFEPVTCFEVVLPAAAERPGDSALDDLPYVERHLQGGAST